MDFIFCSPHFFFNWFRLILSFSPHPWPLSFLTSLSLFPSLLRSLSFPITWGNRGYRGKAPGPRFHLLSLLDPKGGQEKRLVPSLPALRKNGAQAMFTHPNTYLLPFSSASKTGPLLSGAVGSSSAHTENVRTTNKISIKLSFVSSSHVFFWGRVDIREPKVAFS